MIKLGIKHPFSHLPVFFYPEAESTMDCAQELYIRYKTSGIIAAAGHQKSGRGRVPSRKWFDVPNSALLCTLVMQANQLEFPVSQLPLRCGLGIADFIQEFVPEADVEIKWPNDVLVGGRKICGILCESRGEAVYAGFGINCRRQELLPEEFGRKQPVSLEELGLFLDSPLSVLGNVLEHLHKAFQRMDWKRALENKLYGIGDRVRFLPGKAAEYGFGGKDGSVVEGKLVGVDEYGGLQIHENIHDSVTVWYAGELI
ncbi:MAG: biotin--[acetyl-CoA-carboxylase] ligase [Spirochaetales bacterium]|jgi:biotin-[acetyl-CoA-carboxylase] ligase BirA-like protein|nr:biotin--[acetyl-CoA-carboxylase] ligase [Spirochaetales bacterium]